MRSGRDNSFLYSESEMEWFCLCFCVWVFSYDRFDPPRGSGTARTLNHELVDSFLPANPRELRADQSACDLKDPFLPGKPFFQVPRGIIAKYAAAFRTQRASPTHARPVHSAITESGHLSVDQRTFSASAKRSHVLGVARTSHLTARVPDVQKSCSLWPVYRRRQRRPESAPSARL